MKVRIYIIALITFLMGSMFVNCSSTHVADKTNKQPLLIYAKGDIYKSEWTKVDSLEQNGLTKSALEEVLIINEKAKKENNHEQIIKSLLIKAKFQAYVQEDAFVKTIDELSLEANKNNAAITPLLHSIIAELYQQYYYQNRWRFLNRTQTINFENSDIATWDLNKILKEITYHCQLSIQNINDLKRTPLNQYNELLILQKESKKYRPFLYDFLSHRALAFFMNEEVSITSPAYKFSMDKEVYLANANDFAKTKIVAKDSMSLKYQALLILQQLTLNHISDTTPVAIIDIELKRLSFVKNNAAFDNSDSLYYSALNDLRKKYNDHPSSAEVTYELANIHYKKGDKYNPIKSIDYKWEKKTALELCQKVINQFPNSYGTKKCKSLISQIKQKSLSVAAEKVNTPELPFRAKIDVKNVSKVYFKIVKLKFDEYKKLNRNHDRISRLDKIKNGEEVRAWELDLKDEKDYQKHSGEFKIDALPIGFYVLITATDKHFNYDKEAIVITPLWVSNISYVNRQKPNGEVEFFVKNRETGKPLQNVEAKLFYEKYNYTSRKYELKLIGTKTTNKEGAFSVVSTNEYRSFYIDFSLGKDRLNTQDAHYVSRRSRSLPRGQTKTFFFTDRAIYRPGQTVYFKGIVLDTDSQNNNKIKSNFKSDVSFYDVNHQKVSTLKLTTNEFGSFSGSFVAPNSGLNGQMHIADKHGNKYFSVEEYKRPKFKVDFTPIKGSYKLEEKVITVGMAKTYSGAALDEAEVNYRVVRNASFPYWCFYRWGYWPQSAEMEIKNGTTLTNNKGEFTVDFIAKADKSINKQFSPTYSYTVYADVVDINGETHSSSTFVSVGYKALKLNVGIPDMLNKNKIDTFLLSTTNLSGVTEPASGSLKIWSLKMPKKYYRESLWSKGDKQFVDKDEFEKSFPYDEFIDENNKYKWEKNVKVFDQKFDTKINKQILLNKLSEWQSGLYVVTATTIDKFGEEVKEIKYFTVYGEDEAKVPVNELGWFTAVKNNGEPKEKAVFLIGSAANDVEVLYEIEHKGEIVTKEWLVLNKGEQRRISIPIEEKHRGNFQVHFSFVKHGRSFNFSSTITVPFTNKKLAVEFETFRNKLLPGQEEEWKIKIKGKKGEQIAAEMVATLYDASLDAFKANYWGLDILKYNYSSMRWQGNSSFSLARTELFDFNWNTHSSFLSRRYDALSWFGYQYGHYGYRYRSLAKGGMMDAMAMEVTEDEEMAPVEESASNSVAEKKFKTISQSNIRGNNAQQKNESEKDKDFETVKARKNFNETAFFYPQLTTNSNGEIIVKFTIPEALTQWKFMGLAHTKDLKTGIITEHTVTQKELMVYPNAPRFFREGDKMQFSTKIINLSDAELNGDAKLIFYDALTSELITDKIIANKKVVPFSVNKEGSTSVSWNITIPEGYAAITYKVVAKSGSFTDGEEMVVPVLTNRMLVTESMPLPIRGNQTKNFKFNKLVDNNSKTLNHHKLTLEFTSNPAWYAIQALPYLMEYPYECAEQIFSRFYANSIASHVANSNPKIKNVFESWKQSSPETFMSNLSKNQELKSLVLEETPWVLNSQNESERKKRVGLLFDLNRMSNELGKALKKLQQLQSTNGGWSWFKGMPESRYMTQHIVTGMGHLDHLGVKNIKKENGTWSMVSQAIRYLDDRIRDDYEWLKKHKVDLKKDHISHTQIQYLYARSYFLKDVEINSKNKEAYNYYYNQAKKYWLSKNRYMQGMIALALHRDGFPKTGIPIEKKILSSLKENAINHDELGMYWKANRRGYFWYQAPIEVQALLIEAFDEVVNDQESVEAMKVWLLKQKQTQDWKTTKATTEACYALLLRGTDILESNQLVDIKIDGKLIDPKKNDGNKIEAGTGYFKTSWNKSEVKSRMGNVTVAKKDDGVAWGAMYWQYFEQLDKITSAETPLKLIKKLFLQQNSDVGPVITPIVEGTKLKVGDKIKVRVELRVDRDMEYLHMKDMRASGLEPINVFSGYRYQDGLGYYESTKDASTNFFFDKLRKGTYVFEYPLRVNVSGNFSNGITSIQSMYAPEFISHSEGVRLKIGE